MEAQLSRSTLKMENPRQIKASKIPMIANSIFELIEQVDAVLARVETMHFAQPILEAGLPPS